MLEPGKDPPGRTPPGGRKMDKQSETSGKDKGKGKPDKPTKE